MGILADEIKKLRQAQPGINPPEAPKKSPLETKQPPKKSPLETKQPPKKAPRSSRFRVFINCYPLGWECAPFSSLLDEAKRAIEEHENVAYWNSIDYARGEKLLSAAILELWREKKPEGDYYVELYSKDYSAVSEHVLDFADEIVRGF